MNEREIKPALIRGWKGVCPNCGSGPIMKDYLTVHKNCAICSEELHHHRADDGPTFVTILICGHILAPLIMISFEIFRPDPIILGLVFFIVFCCLSFISTPSGQRGFYRFTVGKTYAWILKQLDYNAC